MSRIILISSWFPKYDKSWFETGKKEFLVSHGIDEDTGRNVILPCEPPQYFEDAKFDSELNEWYLEK